MEKQSLIKVLTVAGVGSRRKMSEAIKSGRVMVNGGGYGFNHRSIWQRIKSASTAGK